MNDDDDGLAGLVGLGIIVAAGVGLYQILKSIGSYKGGEVVAASDVPLIAASVQRSQSHSRSYAYCEAHGDDSEQCQAGSIWHTSENRCIKCNDGVGDSYGRWCQRCQHDWDTNND